MTASGGRRLAHQVAERLIKSKWPQSEICRESHPAQKLQLGPGVQSGCSVETLLLHMLWVLLLLLLILLLLLLLWPLWWWAADIPAARRKYWSSLPLRHVWRALPMIAMRILHVRLLLLLLLLLWQHPLPRRPTPMRPIDMLLPSSKCKAMLQGCIWEWGCPILHSHQHLGRWYWLIWHRRHTRPRLLMCLTHLCTGKAVNCRLAQRLGKEWQGRRPLPHGSTERETQ